MELAEIKAALEELEKRIINRRKMETMGTPDYKLWTEDLHSVRRLFDLVVLAELNQIIL
jgi:hypothetical protein